MIKNKKMLEHLGLTGLENNHVKYKLTDKELLKNSQLKDDEIIENFKYVPPVVTITNVDGYIEDNHVQSTISLSNRVTIKFWEHEGFWNLSVLDPFSKDLTKHVLDYIEGHDPNENGYINLIMKIYTDYSEGKLGLKK